MGIFMSQQYRAKENRSLNNDLRETELETQSGLLSREDLRTIENLNLDPLINFTIDDGGV